MNALYLAEKHRSQGAHPKLSCGDCALKPSGIRRVSARARPCVIAAGPLRGHLFHLLSGPSPCSRAAWPALALHAVCPPFCLHRIGLYR